MPHRLMLSRLKTPASAAAVVALLLGAGCSKNPAAAASADAAKAKSATTAAAPAAPAAAKVSTRDEVAAAQFHKVVEPILRARCFDCHGDGSEKGGVNFDNLTPERLAHQPSFWLKVLKNTRSQVMPPPDAENPLKAEEQVALEDWIRSGAFGLDPAKPDPGRVTIHRLNRTEYTNSIYELLGVTYNAEGEFPHDDSGYGFENVADVLNMSPLLMEKYLSAAQSIVDKAVPKVNRVPQMQIAGPNDFKDADGKPTEAKAIRGSGLGADAVMAIAMPYTKEAVANRTFAVTKPGQYRVVVEKNFRGDFAYVPQKAEIVTMIDGKEVLREQHTWEANNNVESPYLVDWQPGDHTIQISLKPMEMEGRKPGNAADNVFHIKQVRLEGPLAQNEWVPPATYARFFPRDTPPTGAAERRAYAKEVIGTFATKAFRRPTTAESIDPLVEIAEKYYNLPGNTFESGVAQAMVAVISSPRFLFRASLPEASPAPAAFAKVDEYSLASRLSFFLWSTMPDAELLKLAGEGKLRANLQAQVKRMLDDKRSHQFVEHFTGQWLQSRLVSTVPLSPREILERETPAAPPPAPAAAPVAAAPAAGAPVAGAPAGFAGRGGRGGRGGGPGVNLTDEAREALKTEPEKYFEHVMRENRSIDEFLASDYTFMDETLAKWYKVQGVTGPEWRKVTLPATDLRGGGVLTMGSVLMITSNPTRTSPVKRGKWILDNILDAPTPPPPPNVPALEDIKPKSSDHIPTLRETMAIHREDAICASCHNRMDPLGLAFENFSALGLWRTEEFKQPIDASGVTSTGDKFAGANELKKLLLAKHKTEFYRALTEKLLIYATGRGMEYYDVPTVDKIVTALEQNKGSFSTLLMGVIESAPFQQQRTLVEPVATATGSTPRLSQ